MVPHCIVIRSVGATKRNTPAVKLVSVSAGDNKPDPNRRCFLKDEQVLGTRPVKGGTGLQGRDRTAKEEVKRGGGGEERGEGVAES